MNEAFICYRHDPNNQHSLANNSVYAICEDSNEFLWIGTNGGGLDRFDRQKGTFIHYQHQSTNPYSLSHDKVRFIYEDRQGALWIGTLGGLNKFDNKTQKFTRYQRQSNNPYSLSDYFVMSIFEDSQGLLWIGTYDGGLNKFDRANNRFTRFRQQPGNPHSLSNNTVRSIHEDEQGTLWIGTADGLNKFDKETEKFTRLQHDPDKAHCLSNNHIWTIYEDKQKVLWLGTNGGLNRLDRKTGKFSCYREKDGLANDKVYGILEDDFGNLWLSTGKGIDKFDPQSGIFINYDEKDGLQSDLFNQGAFHKGKSGRFYFGGENGFNEFYPDSIRQNTCLPPVVITDFLLFNRSVAISDEGILEQNINFVDGIYLDYTEYMFSFEFSALNYRQSEKNQFAYMLQGYDKDWIYTGSENRKADYTSVPPGKYVFKVKASNDDGLWNENGISIKTKLHPPPWKAWWVYLIISLAIIGLITSSIIIWLQRKKVTAKAASLQETLKKLKDTQAQLIQSEKIAALGKLIAGIAHEINTPLGAIKASISNISDALNDSLQQLPQLLSQLSTEQQLNFFALVEKGLMSRESVSFREERKYRRSLTRALEKKQIEDAETVASTLVGMGIYEDFDDFIPLLKTENASFILQAANNLVSQQKNSRNIRIAVDKASKVVFALKSYARHDYEDIKIEANISEGIDIVLALYYNRLKQGIEVIKQYETVPSILCYPDELNQVWTNIIHNGVQAMINKGRLIIKVCREENHIAVHFTDSGSGIAEEIKDRIFEPFFTTKAAGEGSGLGLDIVRRIVEKHQGRIEVASKPGQTTFSVFLPISK